MLANSYTGVVDQDIPQLIAVRAKRYGLRMSEIDDLQQQIIPKLLTATYDPANATGASRTTFITGVIDRQLRAYLRAKARYQKRLERLHAISGSPTSQDMAAAPVPPTDLRIDLQAAMETLSERDRRICRMLQSGDSQVGIAAALGCGRNAVLMAIHRIRKAFTAAGLRAWVEPDCDAGDQVEAGHGNR